MAAGTIYDAYGNIAYSFNTPSGGFSGGPGVGGSMDPMRDYIWRGNHVFGGSLALAAGALLQESAVDSITAHAGGTQAAAFQLTSELNRIATVATIADSVMLPPSQVGTSVQVINHGANACQVFGAGTDTVDDIATATGVSQMANSTCFYFCVTPGKWYTEGLATGYATSLGLQTLSYEAAITAHAGGGQAAGYPITKMMSRVSTVASANDSVTLPVSAPGLQIAVYNSTATSMNVFPNAGGTGTETINALAANAAFAIASNATPPVVFYCWIAGQWYTK